MRPGYDQTGVRGHLATLDLPQGGSNCAYDAVHVRDRWQLLISNPDLRASTENLIASLFFYQRAVPREVGWFAFRDDECLTGLRLWLRLHERPTPETWRFDEYAIAWDRRIAEEKSHAADVVRRWLSNGEGTWSP
mgnify:CR=1 FL=1